MTKPLRCIVCEGKDDLAAFRAVLKVEGAVRSKRPGAPVGGGNVQRFETDRVEITVEARDGKTDLVQVAMDAATGTAGRRPDMILVSFDPDLDPPPREFAFFEKAFEAHKQGRLAKDEAGRRTLRIKDRDIVLLPGPWRTSSVARFAGLPEEQCIERVLVDGILGSRRDGDPVAGWAHETMRKLHVLARDKGFKRAFRLWSAALAPDSESFVARLFEMHETSGACLDAVKATPAYNALRTLLDG
jgi:hypothetical protein